MKIGKLTGNIPDRAVRKQIHHRRRDIAGGLSDACNFIAVDTDSDEIPAVVSETVAEPGCVSGGRCIFIAANALAAAGAEPAGVMLDIFLPPVSEEAVLRSLIQDADAACRELNMAILDVHTEVSSAVNRPVVSVTGIGKAPKIRLPLAERCVPGSELVLSKWIALEATAMLAKWQEEELSGRFSRNFIREAAEFGRYYPVLPDARAALSGGALAMRCLGEGGIFRTLWEMADAAGCGLDIDLKAVPIRQETVEICEFFHINPYQAMSGGSLLIAAENGERLVRRLSEAGIPSAVIGYLTDGNDRILRNEEEIRYLDRPQQDALLGAGFSLPEGRRKE